MDIDYGKVNNLFSLKGKVAIVTGASRGLGKAIALGFSGAGAKVVLAARGTKPLETGERAISEAGGQALAVRTDVSSREDLENLVNKTIDVFGTIDVLVNCAGSTKGAPSHNYSQIDWELTYRTNLKSAFDLCQLVGRVMIKEGRGGSIINITSVAAELGSPGNPAYNASKGGLRQLSKGLAADWGKYKIRVNNLGPGYFHTELNSVSWNDPELRDIRSKRCLLNRWAEPVEIIGPAIFLASEASSFVTGHDLYVDGGFLAKSL
jgi:NAD(P)-dependent dehydrogenase (short-subunit alcohol dehydrogenase family)